MSTPALFSSARPAASRTVPSAGRSARSGSRVARPEPIQTPGIEPIEDVARQREVDVAAHEVGDRGDPQQQRGVEDVGADDAARREAVADDQRRRRSARRCRRR